MLPGLRVCGLGGRLQGFGVGVQGLGLRVEGLGCRVQGLQFRVYHRFRLEGLGLRGRSSSGLRVRGARVRRGMAHASKETCAQIVARQSGGVDAGGRAGG